MGCCSLRLMGIGAGNDCAVLKYFLSYQRDTSHTHHRGECVSIRNIHPSCIHINEQSSPSHKQPDIFTDKRRILKRHNSACVSCRRTSRFCSSISSVSTEGSVRVAVLSSSPSGNAEETHRMELSMLSNTRTSDASRTLAWLPILHRARGA